MNGRPLFRFLLTKFLRWRLKSDKSMTYISITSVSLSMFAGKMMFHNFRYGTKDHLITVVDGYITMR